MKRLLILSVIIANVLLAMAQSEPSAEIKELESLVLQLRQAIKDGGDVAIRQTSKKYFTFIEKVSGSENGANFELHPITKTGLNNHTVFTPNFIDSLLSNRDAAFAYAQSLEEEYRSSQKTKRGLSESPLSFDHVVVKANSKLELSTQALKGTIELLVVTEPYGSVTMKIKNMSTNEVYRDNKKESEGMPSRIHRITLDKPSKLRIELTNCSDLDRSMVIFCRVEK